MQPLSRSSWWTSRLIAWLLVLAMVVLAGVAVLMYTAYQQAASALVVERDRQVALLSAARLSDELTAYADVLEGVARTPAFYQEDVALRLGALQEASFRLAVFDAGSVLLDNFGVVQATQPMRPALSEQDWSDRPIFQQLIGSAETSGGLVISDGVEQEDGSMVMIVSVPLIDDQGQFAGALAGMFSIGESTVSSFYASIVRLRIGQTGTTYVVDGNGRILYDSSYEQVRETFDLATLPAGTGLSLGGAGRTLDADGHDIVAAHASVPGTDWTLITEDDWATVTSDARRYARLLLGLLVVGPILPTMGMALLLRRRGAENQEVERRRRETRMADVVRQRLLPQYVPLLPGYELAVYHRAEGSAAGDFYDYLILSDGRLMLAVGDVADGSVRAALVTASVRATLRGAAHLELSPAEALAYGNDVLCPDLEEGQAISCLYALLDPEDGRLVFANAAQPIACYRADGHSGDLLPACPALGLAPAATYEQGEIVIGPGECVLLGSGGVLQARNEQGDAFGLPRLRDLLEQETSCGQTLVDGLRSALEAFAGESWLSQDDVTLVALARTAPSEEA